MKTGLIAEDLTFRYSGGMAPVLRDFSLELPKGSFTLVTGVSGCGKSTLCGVLAGTYPRHGGILEKGRVLCDGLDVHGASVSERAKKIGMMFQNPDLQFCMDTVENELVFCLENICVPPAEIPSHAEEALVFCGIEHLRSRKLHTLSGGEKQKVMLACIAALGSEYIILDEPFANIDPHSSKLLLERLLRFQKEKGTTLLIVDHAVSNFLHIVDELVVLGEGGKILQRGINSGNFSAHTAELDSLGVSVPGSDYEHLSANSSRGGAQTQRKEEIIFSLREVKSGYDGAEVLQGTNIDFHKGCMTAITGESGSGKSTLLAVLARMNPYKGSIKMQALPDQDLREISHIPRKSYAKQVGIVFQNPQDQFVANTVYEEIAVSLRGIYEKEEMELRVRKCLEEIGLWDFREFSPYMLSQGQQRRLAVGALLAYECKVLLCDEPTYGQDRRSIESIMNFLQRRVLSDGLTVIFSTHDLCLAESYGDYHYCCDKGKLYVYAKDKPEL